MDLTRRDFIKLIGGGATGAIVFSACGVPDEELYFQSPNKLPEDQVTGIDNWYATLGSNGEGLAVRIMEGRAKKVEGNTDYPSNTGAHSYSNEAELQILYHPERLESPLVRDGNRGSGKWIEIGWNDAYQRINDQLNTLRHDKSRFVTKPLGGRSNSVISAFSDELGNKLLSYSSFDDTNLINALNIITGSGNIPKLDIGNSDMVLNFGMDFLNSSYSQAMFGREYGKFRTSPRGNLYHIEPRLSLTATNSDEWIFCELGTEGMIASAIAYVLISEKLVNTDFAKKINSNDLSGFTPEKISKITGVKPDKIVDLAHKLAKSKHPLIIGGDTASGNTNGSSNMIAIYALNLLLGNINKEGGLILNPDSPLADLHSSRTTSSYQEILSLIGDIDSGTTNSLFINQVDLNYSVSGNINLKSSLSKLGLIVSMNSFIDDTSQYADIILPLNTQFESWGNDVPEIGPGYEVVGFQQPIVKSRFSNKGRQSGTKSVEEIIMELSNIMDFKNKYSGKTMKEILMDDAKNIMNLNRGSIRANDLKTFWNGLLSRGGWWDVKSRVSKSGKTKLKQWPKINNPEFSSSTSYYHLIPFKTTVSDGSLANLPWLQGLTDPMTTIAWETWVEINEQEADKLKIKEGDVLEIDNGNGRKIKAVAYPTPATPPNVLSVPVGGGQKTGRYTSGFGTNIYSIMNTSYDRKTGAHAWASNKVNIKKTKKNIKIPKFEGRFEETKRDPHNHVIKIKSSDSDH